MSENIESPPSKRMKLDEEPPLGDDNEDERETKPIDSATCSNYGNYVTAEELQKLREFKVLDEVKSNEEDSHDEDSDSSDGKSEGLPEDEIEKMLEEDLPEGFKGVPKPKEKPYVTRQKIVLEEKGVNQFEVLPLDWLMVRHVSGMPVYMHRPSRVCTLAKPYFLGKGNTRRHEIPISAIPCLAYRRALEEEEKQNEIDRQIAEQIKNGTWVNDLDQKTDPSQVTSGPTDNKTESTSQKFLDDSAHSLNVDVKSDKVCPIMHQTSYNDRINEGSVNGPVTGDSQTNESKTNDKKISHSKSEFDCENTMFNVPIVNDNDKFSDKRNNGTEKANTIIVKKEEKPTAEQTQAYPTGFNDNEISSDVGQLNESSVKVGQKNENDDIEEKQITDSCITVGQTTEGQLNDTSVDTVQINDKSFTMGQVNENFANDVSVNAGQTNEGSTSGQVNDSSVTAGPADDTTVNETVGPCRRPVILPGGAVMPPPRVETVNTSWKTQHLTPELINDYCKALFKFKTVNIMHFKRWADRRKYTKARKTLQYPTLPEGTKLISIPAQPAAPHAPGKAKRDWVMNMNGCSYLSVFHEYVRRALHKQPVYEFKQLENACSPYQATVYIDGMQYGVGRGSSKRQAKAAAARASIHILIPEMRDEPPPRAAAPPDPDFTFFDYVGIEDPRIQEFCTAASEPSPHAILRTCLLRNFGAQDRHIHTEMKKLEYQKIELTMKVGKHSATVVCKNKKQAKQRASQSILQQLHPHIRSWGSLLRLYGSRSVKSCKEKKLEEQQITLLQDKARHNEPNHAVLDKLRHEMRRLRERDAAVVPIGTLLLQHALPTHSGSNLNNVDL